MDQILVWQASMWQTIDVQVLNRSSFDNVFGATGNAITKGISCPFNTRRGGFSIKSSFEVSLIWHGNISGMREEEGHPLWMVFAPTKTCSNRDLHQIYEPSEFTTLVLHRFMCDEPTRNAMQKTVETWRCHATRDKFVWHASVWNTFTVRGFCGKLLVCWTCCPRDPTPVIEQLWQMSFFWKEIKLARLYMIHGHMSGAVAAAPSAVN